MLQRRASELAATMAKPMILEAELKALFKRLRLPPSLPGDLSSLDEES